MKSYKTHPISRAALRRWKAGALQLCPKLIWDKVLCRKRGVLRISRSPYGFPIHWEGTASLPVDSAACSTSADAVLTHLVTCTSGEPGEDRLRSFGVRERNVHSDPLYLRRRSASAQCSWHDIFNRCRFKGRGFTANDLVRDHQTKRLILLIGYPPDAIIGDV